MLWTPHLLAGAAIAAKISNPFIFLPLAFLSHYFLDSLPQEEYSIMNIQEKRWNKTFWDFFKVFLDFSLGILLILLFSDRSQIIFAGAFLAISPDGVTFLQLFITQNKLINQHQKIHVKIQKAINGVFYSKNKEIPIFWGIFSQTAVILIAIFLLR